MKTQLVSIVVVVALLCLSSAVVHAAAAKEEPAATHCMENPAMCDDGNDYTADICDPDGRCLHQPIRTCTHADRWMNAAQCNDNNPCTNDRCFYGHCNYEEVENCSVNDDGTAELGHCAVDGCRADSQCPNGSYCKTWDRHAPYACQGCPDDDPCCARTEPHEQGDGFHEMHCAADKDCPEHHICDDMYCIPSQPAPAAAAAAEDDDSEFKW